MRLHLLVAENKPTRNGAIDTSQISLEEVDPLILTTERTIVQKLAAPKLLWTNKALAEIRLRVKHIKVCHMP